MNSIVESKVAWGGHDRRVKSGLESGLKGGFDRKVKSGLERRVKSGLKSGLDYYEVFLSERLQPMGNVL